MVLLVLMRFIEWLLRVDIVWEERKKEGGQDIRVDNPRLLNQ